MNVIHPRRAALHIPAGLGERLADAIAARMGSWPFIIAQTVFVGVWITCNIAGFVLRWDAYPFILLNLLFSTQAAYAAPVIMMSQNRQAAKDRIRDDLEAREVDDLHGMQQQQLEILRRLDTLQAQQMELLARPVSLSANALPDALPSDRPSTKESAV